MVMSDTQLRKDCEVAISRLGPHPDVQLQVTQGWVSIRGSVLLGSDRWKVEEAVSRVSGVVGAGAQLSVRSAPDQ
jgi:osmotically-inducible protein OsmY